MTAVNTDGPVALVLPLKHLFVSLGCLWLRAFTCIPGGYYLYALVLHFVDACMYLHSVWPLRLQLAFHVATTCIHCLCISLMLVCTAFHLATSCMHL